MYSLNILYFIFTNTCYWLEERVAKRVYVELCVNNGLVSLSAAMIHTHNTFFYDVVLYMHTDGYRSIVYKNICLQC